MVLAAAPWKCEQVRRVGLLPTTATPALSPCLVTVAPSHPALPGPPSTPGSSGPPRAAVPRVQDADPGPPWWELGCSEWGGWLGKVGRNRPCTTLRACTWEAVKTTECERIHHRTHAREKSSLPAATGNAQEKGASPPGAPARAPQGITWEPLGSRLSPRGRAVGFDYHRLFRGVALCGFYAILGCPLSAGFQSELPLDKTMHLSQ